MTTPPAGAGGRFLCAEAARTRGDPLPGTAPHTLTWILIEHPGGWPPNGFDGLDLDAHTKNLVYTAARAIRARILLIRRPGRRTTRGPRRWAVLRHDTTGAHRQEWGTWTHDRDLQHITEALTVDPCSPGRPGHRPVILVCTHGRHDTCCALRGRPVAHALARHWPDLVWESSHTGGDRFAPNILVAPDGVHYGQLDPASSVTAVEAHLGDRIRAEHLRGYTDLYPPQQVAVTALLARFGPAGRHHYTVTDTTRLADNHWRIHISAPPPQSATLEVEVRSHHTPRNQLTCNGPSPSSTVIYTATAIHTR
ncbi:sucrase ferredoxin [Streptomyces longisporoflavus]|uniref:Sucrase ferredoxin n=1 Tax=Streptomyces longisporoflavus TaxID=28044 RepID=A0ABW7QRH9_9ACTN